MDFYDVWDYIVDGVQYFFSFEWFTEGVEAMSNIEDSPMSSIWFWIFYIALMAGVWYLPTKLGMLDYKLWEKFMYSILFFIIDWFMISHFRSD